MSEIRERLAAVRGEIARHCEACGRDPAMVELLPVSKKHSAESIREAFAAGCAVVGENRVQELVPKAEELLDLDLRWDMVGSLQTNKAKRMLRVRNLRMLQSLDRVSLADSLQKALADADRKLPVLLQIRATGEESKHGCPPEEADALLDHVQSACPHLSVTGLMAMGPLVGDPAPVFRKVADLREELRRSSGLELPVLSMGMTDDMDAAIAAGSTMVRVGTGVFGPRG